MNDTQQHSPFNSSLETGVRALVILVASYPATLDLQRLVDFDYLVVHSGDVNGPDSLHPPLPMRAGELLVRREIIESGILLMMSRGFIERVATQSGFGYAASHTAKPFLDSLSAPYLQMLQNRADWAASQFGQSSNQELQEITSHFFDKWTTQFHPSQGLVRE